MFQHQILSLYWNIIFFVVVVKISRMYGNKSSIIMIYNIIFRFWKLPNKTWYLIQKCFFWRERVQYPCFKIISEIWLPPVIFSIVIENRDVYLHQTNKYIQNKFTWAHSTNYLESPFLIVVKIFNCHNCTISLY